MSSKTAIIAAINGATKQKSDHPNLPITTEEIVQDVVECRDAGAVMVHVHARDNQGNHSLEVEDNLKLLAALQDELGDSVIMQLTTEAVGRYEPEQQKRLIKAVCPPAVSFALRELIPNNDDESSACEFFNWVAEQGILSQYILYDREDVKQYLRLCREKLLPRFGRHALLVLGRNRRPLSSHPSDLLPLLLDELIDKESWAACAFGKKEYQCLTTAMLLSGDIRVGFENNLLDPQGNLALSNASQVSNMVNQANTLNLDLHSVESYRSYLEKD
ncbi:3-keto-5-aminohexanoate cleavage protein [Vibrio sp. S4M6]|uniref:3-keto-5-aminohexanoate cleavage protein n=1 Tax=Vibrio sinus TaxID=2946865 RepID=UPI00202AA07D|nr:3-keto-5-aminohexanoate cleavage protein [Vibrio sinus]MCL9782764.1 3-keto-5-aminohexanoate cleavage protein [Vibrio sinus]